MDAKQFHSLTDEQWEALLQAGKALMPLLCPEREAKPETLDRDWLDTVNRTMQITPRQLACLCDGLAMPIYYSMNPKTPSGKWWARRGQTSDGLIADFGIVRDELDKGGEYEDLFDKLAKSREVALTGAIALLRSFSRGLSYGDCFMPPGLRVLRVVQ